MINPPSKIKILIATGLYPPEIGGPATHTVLLEKKLPASKYLVEVLPFSVSRNKPKVIRHIDYFIKVIKKAKDADIIFSQDVGSVGLPSLFAAKILRKFFIVRVPGDYAWEQSVQRYGVTDGIDDFQNLNYGIRVKLLQLVQKTITKFADHVVTPSNYFKELVSGWGVKKDKIVTIYNGIELSELSGTEERMDKPTIVTAGRLVPWKGFDKLLELVAQLRDWNLVIIGDGPDEVRLKSKAAELEVSDRVLFTGSISRDEVLSMCQRATVFVLNTHFESFSYQIVEVMSIGTPIVTTKVGSLPELITNGREGVLVEPDDLEAIKNSLHSVQSEKEIWKNRTERAMLKSQQFSVNNTISGFDELFSNTIKK